MRTYGRTDMTNLTVGYRNFENVPNKNSKHNNLNVKAIWQDVTLHITGMPSCVSRRSLSHRHTTRLVRIYDYVGPRNFLSPEITRNNILKISPPTSPKT